MDHGTRMGMKRERNSWKVGSQNPHMEMLPLGTSLSLAHHRPGASVRAVNKAMADANMEKVRISPFQFLKAGTVLRRGSGPSCWT